MIINMASGEPTLNSENDRTQPTERIKCWICPAKFFTAEQEYEHHIEMIHQGFRFCCEECDDVTLFKTIQEARDHVDDRHDINLQQCPNCEKSFNAFNLRRHFSEVHQTVRQYECSLCEKERFDDRGKYENHVFHAHQGFRVKCHICHRMLKTKLKPHIEYIHSNGTAKCNICGREYSNKYKLMRHLKCHTDPKEPGTSVRCERCDETFDSVSKLNYHKAKHQTKIHQCDKCSKMFYRNGALVQHQKTHEESELHCELCNKSFNNVNHFRKHMRGHNKRQYKERKDTKHVS
ncbi:zinc finger protein 225-like [Toxorhynchites rutilus septentrionalis]|uniref:zinc finger protein 225-like n=1 Tax=Toxorhynchites rutilus septentrionalis TaxID=329112 RepID=UPI002478C80B|nr:zinc finger protein 225-like [Toxorhynchites rutilus septentrionalis]